MCTAPTRNRDQAVFVAYDLWRGLAFHGGVRLADGLDESLWRTVGMRVPIRRNVSLTLARSAGKTNNSDRSANLVGVNLPLGPIRLMQRYQWSRVDYRRSTEALGLQQQQLQSTASYSPTRRISFGMQMANEWQADGRVRQWQELLTTLQLSRRSELQLVSGFPHVSEARQFRVHYAHELPKRFSLTAEYGRLSAFQSTGMLSGEQSRFKLMLRKSSDVSTPAVGGELHGVLVDAVGDPVGGVAVRLGPYRVVTDAHGRYAFVKMPAGEYDLSLDIDSLPANNAWSGTTTRVTINRTTRRVVNLTVVSLNAIHGRVYCDRNRNNVFDPGEEVMSIVVRFGNLATATDQNGFYAFHGVPPGDHLVRLDVQRLPADYELVSSEEILVKLTPDEPARGVDFRLVLKQKRIIMQEPSR